MSFDGTWDLTVPSPMGAKVFRIVISTAGGAVEGTVAAGGAPSPLLDPVLEDGHLRWAVKLPPPMNARRSPNSFLSSAMSIPGHACWMGLSTSTPQSRIGRSRGRAAPSVW